MFGFGNSFKRILPRLDKFIPSILSGLKFWGDTVDNQYVNGYLAADFVSANSEYLSSTSTNFDKADEDFSFGCWVKFDGIGSDEAVIGKWNSFSNTRSYIITKNSSNFFTFSLSNNGSSATTVTWSSTAAATVWYFVVGVYDSVNDLMKLSINGQDFKTASFSGGAFNSSEPFTISRFRAGGAGAYVYSDGQVDAPFFYDKALTLAEVKAIYNAGAGTDISLLENHNNTQYAIAQDLSSASSQYLSSASTDFNFGNEDFSISCWVKFDAADVGVSKAIFSKYNTGQRSYMLLKNGATERAEFYMSSDGTTIDSTVGTTALAHSTWYFITCVYDSVNDLAKISVNGADFQTASNSLGAYAASTETFNIGRFNAIYSNCQVDSPNVYSKALSLAEVKALYNSGNGIGYPSLTSLNGNQYAIGQSFTAASSQSLSSTSTDFDKGNESFSFGGWFKVDSFVATFDGMMGKYLATGNQRSYVLGCYDVDDTWRFTISTDGTYSAGVTGQQISASTLVQFGVWQFVVCVYDATNDIMKISVNGENFVTASWSLGAFAASTADFEIGASSGFPSNVDIDSTFFYDKALSLAEVKAIYNSSNGVAYSSLTSLNGTTYSYATSFNGTTDAMNIDSVLTPLAATTQGTWSFWVKPVDATPAGANVLMSFGDTNGTSQMNFNIQPAGTYIRFGFASFFTLEALNPFSDNTWSHIAIVQNGVKLKIYHNGVELSTNDIISTDFTAWFSDVPLLDNGRIGCLNYNSGGDTFFSNGSFDTVAIYSDAKSPAEISTIYNAGLGQDYAAINKTNLVAFYSMDGIEDSTSNGYAGSYIGTPTIVTGKVESTITSIESSLVSWWEMDDVEGALQTDSVTLSANDLTPVNTPISTLGKVNDTTIATIESSLVSWYEMNSVEGALQVDSVTLSGNDLSAINTPVSTVGKVNDTTITTIESNLVSWWTLNQASGTRYDAVGTNDLTDNNTVGTATGKIQEYDLTYLRYRAASFNGTTDAVNVDSVVTPMKASATGTINFWYKPVDATPAAADMAIAFGDTDAANYLVFRHDTDGKLSAFCRYAGTDYWIFTSDNVIFSDNTWSLISIVQNGTTVLLYVNGSLVGTTFSTSNDETFWLDSMPLIDNARIACNNINSAGDVNFAQGDFDTVSFYSDAKSATEISDIYNGGTGQSYTDIDKTNLVAFYGFDDSNNLASDSTSVYDGSLIGTPSLVAGKVLEPILNEGDNIYTALDKSGNSHNLLQATIANQPTFVNGNAFSFNGTTDFLQNTSIIAGVQSDTVGSLSFRFKTGDYTNVYNIVTFATTAGNTSLIVRNQGDGNLRFLIISAGSIVTYLATTTAPIGNNTWYYVTVNQDAVNPWMMINGVKYSVALANASYSAYAAGKTNWLNSITVNNFNVGANIVSGSPAGLFSGEVGSDIVYTSSVITEGQAIQLYNYSKANFE